jgi:hypothetical protein
MSENEMVVLVGKEVWRIGFALGIGTTAGALFAIGFFSIILSVSEILGNAAYKIFRSYFGGK